MFPTSAEAGNGLFRKRKYNLGVKFIKHKQLYYYMNFCFYEFFKLAQFTVFLGFSIFANLTLFSRACFEVFPASSEAGIGFIRSRKLDLELTDHIQFILDVNFLFCSLLKLDRLSDSRILPILRFRFPRSS